MKECRIDGCERPSHAKGMCSLHYYRWVRNGDPTKLQMPKLEKFYQEVVIGFKGNECLIWPFGRSKNGRAAASKNDKSYSVCRRICEETHGPAPSPIHQAAHTCGKGHEGCVNPNHLEWKTPKENCEDRKRHGTEYHGDRHHKTKVTDDEVREIRSINSDMTYKEIGKLYGIRKDQVKAIRNRKSRKYI